MRLALYQPDIPPNTGTLLRLSACLDVSVDIIEPCGFPFNDRSFRRAGLDYLQHASFVRHLSWQTFVKEFRTRVKARLVLLGHEDPDLLSLVERGATAASTVSVNGLHRSLQPIASMAADLESGDVQGAFNLSDAQDRPGGWLSAL